jgi:hypothetical protein
LVLVIVYVDTVTQVLGTLAPAIKLKLVAGLRAALALQ